ncbi:MAG: EscR/YscR/HrcR family type III secretion system export apparatus protein [Candidatus Fischerbacteria bacterium RBG_13_37_8]|uniref:EscR/YscR/HrcR family type III secretion system export apparatus protein n=1 Tax=Candidatus Fischerbacteria bacterium RBG_13_37_8 TaxID=1817863 RepID=A0A1F5VQP0_9BACT|nr:MAG: EscR/YscR/HrcR family type III secretion system export apparatus protein [Candidatus Fischerbacteria bacterium RBG_13_37_8]
MYAQDGATSVKDRPLLLIVAIAGIALAPFVVMMMTSFVKISVVFSILRSALGTHNIPPNQVLIGFSLILTLYIMLPVGVEIRKTTAKVIKQETGEPLLSHATVENIIQISKAATGPVKKFLSRNAHPKDKHLFYTLALRMNNTESGAKIEKEDLLILVPAFVISELKEAFEIGFIIFIPFIVIDLVVSNILLSLGMFMLSPMMISLPFKLLLFVMVDGWCLLSRGLILGYTGI